MKKMHIWVLGLVSLVCSRALFYFINDPEGPNLLIVVVGAIILFALSSVAYLLNLSAGKKLAGAILIQLALVAGFYFYQRPPETVLVQGFDGRNTSFVIEGNEVVLVDGISEVEAAPGSASKITTNYFGNELSGDLTGDGVPDISYFVTQSTGGSGLFYYVVVAMKTESGYKNTNAFFIGDRIAPQNMYIPGGTTELHVNFAQRKDGEPMTAQPSQGAVTLLKVTREGILEGLMK